MTACVTPKKMKALCITCIIFASLYAMVAVAFLLLGSFCSSEVSDTVYNVGYLDVLTDKEGFIECAAALTGWDGASVHLAMLCAVCALMAGVAFNVLTIAFAIVYLVIKKKWPYDVTLPLSSSGAYLTMIPILAIAAVQTLSHVIAALNKSASLLAVFVSQSAILLWIFLNSPLIITLLYVIITGCMKKVKKKKLSRKEKKAAEQIEKQAIKEAKAEKKAQRANAKADKV